MVGQGKTGALGGAILIGVCGIERETECVCAVTERFCSLTKVLDLPINYDRE